MANHIDNEIGGEQGKYYLHDLGKGILWAVFNDGIILVNAKYEGEFKRHNPEAIRA